MLSVQTWKYSSLRFVCVIMKCAGYVERVRFPVSSSCSQLVSFPRLKNKIKVKSEVFPLENF